jgi:hypothetical protein
MTIVGLKSKIAAICIIVAGFSQKSHPILMREFRGRWIPAFAGMTGGAEVHSWFRVPFVVGLRIDNPAGSSCQFCSIKPGLTNAKNESDTPAPPSVQGANSDQSRFLP